MMPSVWKISSKLAVNWPALSRSSILQPLNASLPVRNRFLAAWVVHGPVGLVVIPARVTLRVGTSMKNSR